MRSALFWSIAQRVVVIPSCFLDPWKCDLSRNVGKMLPLILSHRNIPNERKSLHEITLELQTLFCVKAYLSNAHAHLVLRNVTAGALWETRVGIGIGLRILHSFGFPILFWDQFNRPFFFSVRSVSVSEAVTLIFDSSCTFSSAWTSLISHSISLPIIGWKQKCRTNHYLLPYFNDSWIFIMESEFFLCEFVALWVYLINSTVAPRGPGSSVGIATNYGLNGPGTNLGGGRGFSSVQTGPGGPPSLLYNGYRSFPGVKCGRGVLLTTHPLLVPRSWKSRAIHLPTLWATPGL